MAGSIDYTKLLDKLLPKPDGEDMVRLRVGIVDGFTVTRRFRGAVYHITVDNAAGVQHGIKAVTVDGKAISGNVLPLAAAGTEVTVQVTMG